MSCQGLLPPILGGATHSLSKVRFCLTMFYRGFCPPFLGCSDFAPPFLNFGPGELPLGGPKWTPNYSPSFWHNLMQYRCSSRSVIFAENNNATCCVYTLTHTLAVREWRCMLAGKNPLMSMKVPSTSRASLVSVEKNHVGYFLNRPRTLLIQTFRQMPPTSTKKEMEGTIHLPKELDFWLKPLSRAQVLMLCGRNCEENNSHHLQVCRCRSYTKIFQHFKF